MLTSERLSVIVNNQEEIECPLVLITKSNLLTDIFKLDDNTFQPLPVPSFITKQVIDEIITILQDGTFAGIINSSIQYLIKIEMTLDFLCVTDESEMLLSVIYEKVTTTNSFRVFCMTNEVPCFHDVTMKCALLMKEQLNEYYSRTLLFGDLGDPYLDEYSSFTIFEIEQFFSYCDKYYTVMKVVILKKWVSRNCDCLHTEKLITILENINKEAIYIPRSHIKFMRNVRDEILAEIRGIDGRQSTNGANK